MEGIMVFAGSLIMWGIILMIGPTVLRWILNFASSVNPVCAETVGLLTTLILILVVFGGLYKSATTKKGVFFKKYRSDRIKILKIRQLLKDVLVVLYLMSLIGVIVIAFHPIWVILSSGWNRLMDSAPNAFQVIRIIGIIILALGLGFLAGITYQQKQKDALYEWCEFSDEDASEEKQDEGVTVTEKNLDVTLPESAKKKLEEEKK